MNKVILSTLLVAFWFTGARSQDDIYAVWNYTSSDIYKYSNTTPGGAFSAAPTSIGDVGHTSAALAMNAHGYFYYIPFGTGNGYGNEEGSFDVYSFKAGSGGSSLALTADINGTANTNNVEFKRLGMRSDNWAYMAVTETGTNTVYLARFLTDNNGGAGSFQNLGTMVYAGDPDGDAYYNNGDLVFDASGNMYVIVNSDNNNKTKVFKAQKDDINAATSSSTTTLIYVADLKTSTGTDFDLPVTGAAFSSAGFLYISSLQNIFSIDIENIKNASTQPIIEVSEPLIDNPPTDISLADLASNNFPTALPVKFGEIQASVSNNVLSVNWSTYTENNNDHFEVEASQNGINFHKIGSIKTLAPKGISETPLLYHFSLSQAETNGLLLGLSIFSLGFFALLFNKRNKIFFTMLMVIGLGTGGVSCSKKDAVLPKNDTSNLYIRIKQVDINGTFDYSKTVIAQQKD
ncbi:MAG: hypothetical protein QM727_01545 [Niabella sp.]